MRLNGWQRLGVIATVLWMIGAPLYMFTDQNRGAANFASEMYRMCEEDNAANPSRAAKDCSAGERRDHQMSVAGWDAVPVFVGLAAVPVTLGWLLAYALVALYRWVRAGFPPRAV